MTGLTPRPWLAALSFLLLGTALGCSTRASHRVKPDSSPRRAAPTLSEIFPFQDATVSQFETENDFGESGILILEIDRPRPDEAVLTIAGRRQRLTIGPDRIEHAGGGTLIERPLETGHQFRGSFGTVTIQSTTAQLRVPAGEFEQCLVLVEETIRVPKRSRSVYCRPVGLVELEVESFGAESARFTARLAQHGPRVTF